MIPMFSIVGSSNAGKTTLLEKLISALSQRGYRVGVIKHARHFQVDYPGKDSWRYREAGAAVVALASAREMALMRRWEEEWTPREIARAIPDADLIITEGYKWADLPKLEVCRGEDRECLQPQPGRLLARISDQREDSDLPWFHLEDLAGLTEFIVERFLKDRPAGLCSKRELTDSGRETGRCEENDEEG